MRHCSVSHVSVLSTASVRTVSEPGPEWSGCEWALSTEDCPYIAAVSGGSMAEVDRSDRSGRRSHVCCTPASCTVDGQLVNVR